MAYARNTAPADVFSEPYLVDGWIDGWMPEDLSRFPVASSAAAAAHTLEKNCNIVAKDVANPLRSPAARGSIVRPDPRSQAPSRPSGLRTPRSFRLRSGGKTTPTIQTTPPPPLKIRHVSYGRNRLRQQSTPVARIPSPSNKETNVCDAGAT